MKYIFMNTGRVLLALYFLIPGISKFISWDNNAELMETHEVPMIPIMLTIAGIAQIIGSISLLLNKYVVVCSIGFAVMTIIINLYLHDFWNIYDEVNPERELQNFYKNLGIFAGLLLLAASNMEEKK